MPSKYPIPLLALLLVVACGFPGGWRKEASGPESLHQSMKRITGVIVHDIFSPPVASRIYAYSAIAAYEALRPGYPGYQTLAGQLNELGQTPQPAEGEEYCFHLAALHAMLAVGKTMIFSEDSVAVFEGEIYARFKDMGVPGEVYRRSMDYGRAVAGHILAWAEKDNYKQTRSFPKYTASNNPSNWQPTPPDFMDGIEPHWNKIRPFVLDSANQFAPGPPTAFDPRPGSKFYEEALEVYRALEGENQGERIEIARFWDCNPYVSTHAGHVVYATKKITPGGHWMGITEIACKQAGADAMKSAEAYARVAISLADAFISCWDEKYRSNLVRPETFINAYVDEKWRPTLQTPPFPEYTSGHSVISSAAALALTGIFGEPFPFEDTVEEEYGLPRRTFNSFAEASNEAAASRLYGGIHYRPAIDFGAEQGRKVGHWVSQHLTTEIK